MPSSPKCTTVHGFSYVVPFKGSASLRVVGAVAWGVGVSLTFGFLMTAVRGAASTRLKSLLPRMRGA